MFVTLSVRANPSYSVVIRADKVLCVVPDVDGSGGSDVHLDVRNNNGFYCAFVAESPSTVRAKLESAIAREKL